MLEGTIVAPTEGLNEGEVDVGITDGDDDVNKVGGIVATKNVGMVVGKLLTNPKVLEIYIYIHRKL